MNRVLQQGVCRARWDVAVQQAASGALELYETAVGYAWNWAGKPAHLVSLLGVSDDQQPEALYRFGDLEDAIGHVMRCTGVAFHGQCSLTEPS